MEFEKFLHARGLTLGELTPSSERELRAEFAAVSGGWLPTAQLLDSVPVAPMPIPTAGLYSGPRQNTGAFIQQIAAKAINDHKCDPNKQRQLAALRDRLIAEGCGEQQAQLEFLRAERFNGQLVYANDTGAPNMAEALSISLAQTYGATDADVQGWADARTVDYAFSRRGRGVTLSGLMRAALHSAGQSAPHGKFNDSDIRRAFSVGKALRYQGDYLASVGPSTIDVTGVLSNTANKSLLSSYTATPMTWNKWCATRSVNDFKAAVSYRLTMTGEMQRVAPSGELKHVSMEESSATAQASTYGALLGLSRNDIINDDLGAFMAAPKALARLAAVSLEKNVYVFLMGQIGNGSSFIFDTAKSKNNYDDGATDSVLSLAGLDNAYQILTAQTDGNDDPLLLMPKVLLVPPTLAATARTLMAATGLVGGSTTNAPDSNPWGGMFDVVESPFINNTSITGNTSTGWFLLASPGDFSVVQVCFLQGQQTPTIETGEFDFDRLGLAMRCVFDYGISELDYRGGVHLKGAA